MRIRLNHIALFIFGLLILAIVDSCQGIIESSGVIRVVRGESAPINGKLDSTLPDLEKLRGLDTSPEMLEANLMYESSSELIYLKFLELKGRMWRGEVIVPNDMEPGAFDLVVHQRGVAVDEGTPRFDVRIFKTKEALQADSATFLQRLVGIPPLWLVIVLLPLGLLMLYLAYRQNDKEESRLQSRGLGAIYKLARHKEHWEVIFGLGQKHGIHTGQELYLLDRSMKVKGCLVARKVGEDSSFAEVPLSADIRPSYYISDRISHPKEP